MMVRVYVSLKPSVLDPQGMTIQKALETMGYGEVAEVRQGKCFEIRWEGDLSGAGEREKVERIAAEVLSNPVIESYRIDWPAKSAEADGNEGAEADGSEGAEADGNEGAEADGNEGENR